MRKVINMKRKYDQLDGIKTKVIIDRNLLVFEPKALSIIKGLEKTGMQPCHSRISEIVKIPVSTVFDKWNWLMKKFDIELFVTFKLKESEHYDR